MVATFYTTEENAARSLEGEKHLFQRSTTLSYRAALENVASDDSNAVQVVELYLHITETGFVDVLKNPCGVVHDLE